MGWDRNSLKGVEGFGKSTNGDNNFCFHPVMPVLQCLADGGGIIAGARLMPMMPFYYAQHLIGQSHDLITVLSHFCFIIYISSRFFKFPLNRQLYVGQKCIYL